MATKNNPLIVPVDDTLVCMIANPFSWMKIFQTTSDSDIVSDNELWLEEMGIEIYGCGITFPNKEVKMMFMLKFM